MKLTKIIAGLAAAAILTAGAAVAQTPAGVDRVNSGDLFQDITNGQVQVNRYYATALQLAGYTDTLPATSNVLIGGDATTNLWQRGTTGASVTTTTTYGGPDRWAYWSGTNTAMTVSRDSTAADLPSTGFTYGFKMARTSGQTGVVQVCMAQAIESVNARQLQGQTVELDFNATAGANFSAASSHMTAYIVTGTGTDEGVAKMAYGINAGGGGGAAWTGQANATAAVITISSANGRYAAFGTIPAAATEAGVALCFTPVGTASTNDYIAFSGIQLVKSAASVSQVSTTAGYNCNAASVTCAAFNGRLQGVEQMLQQRYYYELDESSSIYIVAPCSAVDTTHTNCIVSFPVTMRVAPTMTYANGFASPTSTTQATLGACTTLASAATVTSTAAGRDAVLVNCTAATIPAAGVASFLYSNNGSGKIKASAEL